MRDYDLLAIMNDLKPCPFCGGKPDVTYSYSSHGMDGSYKNIVVRCPNCYASMAFAADNFYGREIDTPDDIINRWNRRDSNA
jgi:Lar family restriction alleviation protein